MDPIETPLLGGSMSKQGLRPQREGKEFFRHTIEQELNLYHRLYPLIPCLQYHNPGVKAASNQQAKTKVPRRMVPRDKKVVSWCHKETRKF
jgi:hypothetical protein